MNIPGIPGFEIGHIDLNGKRFTVTLSDEWWLFFTQLVQAIQSNLSNFGYAIPQIDSTTISNLNPTTSKGFLVYNSTTDELEINLAGMFKVITAI